jgi:hypothetical protein
MRLVAADGGGLFPSLVLGMVQFPRAKARYQQLRPAQLNPSSAGEKQGGQDQGLNRGEIGFKIVRGESV